MGLHGGFRHGHFEGDLLVELSGGDSGQDAQLLGRIFRYFRPFAGLMVFVAATIFLTAVMDAALPLLIARGIDQLALKSVLDGFAALAFAASFGIGVAFSADPETLKTDLRPLPEWPGAATPSE